MMKIGLIGTFDVENFGDCLFPELYQHQLSQHRPDAQISLYSPTAQCADILSFDQVNALPAQINDTGFDEDALILIGGETVGLGHSAGTFNFPRDTLSAYLRLWMMPVLSQLDPDTRPKFFGAHCVGATKMPAAVNTQIATVLDAASHCAFRDAFSVSWIKTDDISFPREVDPMFLIDHLRDADQWQALAAAHLPDGFSDGAYIIAQMTMGYGGDDLDAWCDAVTEISRKTGHPVVLLPICHFLDDEAFLAQAEIRLKARGVQCALIAGRINVKHTAALIGRSAGYIGSSLHGAVTAIAFAKPLAVLGHSMDGKHEGSLRAVGITGAVTTTPEGLVGCFETTSARDLEMDRAHAQGAARTSFQTLLTALEAPQVLDPQQAEKTLMTANGLHRLEQDQMPRVSVKEIKRRALRLLHGVPMLSKSYRAFRMRQKLARATR
jgi:hypothetical protein